MHGKQTYFQSLTDRVRYRVNNALKGVGTREHGANLVPGELEGEHGANLVPGELEGEWVIGRKFSSGTLWEIVAHESELLKNNSFVHDLA